MSGDMAKYAGSKFQGSGKRIFAAEKKKGVVSGIR
jgi:hypothetical protein